MKSIIKQEIVYQGMFIKIRHDTVKVKDREYMREINETPRQAGERELLEETGITAKKWRLISAHHNGVHNEGFNYFFLAQDLSTAKNSPDQDEQISGFEFFRFDQIQGLIDQKLIPDLRNRACIWKAQLEIN